MNHQTSAPRPGELIAAELEAALRELRNRRDRHQAAADITGDRAHFAARVRAAAFIQERLGESAETLAETWLLAACADPADTEAPARFVSMLIEAGQLGVAAEWVKWQAARDFSRHRLLIAQARVWLDGGLTRQALWLLLRARANSRSAWLAGQELSRIFALDRRYQAAILVLKPHAEGAHAAEAAQLAERLREQWKAWNDAGLRWHAAIGPLPEDQGDVSALVDRTSDLCFKHRDPVAAEFGVRWLLRRFPRNDRLIACMYRVLFAAHGLKRAAWRVLHIYWLTWRRLPDHARVALLFLEMLDGQPLRVFHAQAAADIGGQFPGDILVQRKLLHQEVLDGSAEHPHLDRVLGSALSPAGLRATCALRAAIRSAEPTRALTQFSSDPAYAEVRQRFPATQWIASQAMQITTPGRGTQARVAICISGQLRSFFEAWPFIESRVVRPLGADVFIDTWRNTGNRPVAVNENLVRDVLGTFLSVAGMSIERFTSIFPRTCQALNGRQSVRESDLEGLTGVRLVRIEDEETIEKAAETVRVSVNQAKMFYKIARAAELVKQHEQAEGFRYDAVMRLRPDFLIRRFDCDEMLATLEHPLDVKLLKRHAAGLDDQFAFGSRDAMMLYASVWPMIELSGSLMYLPINLPHLAERLLFDHLYTCGIRPILASNTDGAIARHLADWPRLLPAFAADAEIALADGVDIAPIMHSVFARAAADLGKIMPDTSMEAPPAALARSILTFR